MQTRLLLLSGVSKSGLAAGAQRRPNALNDGVAVNRQEEEAQEDYDDSTDSYGGLAMAVRVQWFDNNDN